MEYVTLSFQVPKGCEELIRNLVTDNVIAQIKQIKNNEATSLVIADIERDVADFKARNKIIERAE